MDLEKLTIKEKLIFDLILETYRLTEYQVGELEPINYTASATTSETLGSDVHADISGSLSGYIYFGKLNASIVTHTSSEDNLSIYQNGTKFKILSGLVNVGYSGLVALPMEIDGLMFNCVKLLIATGSSNYFYFTGYRLRIK